MKSLGMLAMVLTLVGALNWGLVGVGMLAGGQNWNLVNILLGFAPTVEYVVYLLVGLSAILVAWAHMSGKCEMKG